MTPPYLFFAALAAALLGGCANEGGNPPIPTAVAIPSMPEPKMQSAQHWQSLASATATQILATLRGRTSTYRLGPANGSVFGETYRNLLATEFLRHGVSITQQPAAHVITVDANVVRHPDNHLSGTGTWPPVPTDTEVVISTAILENGYTVARRSDVFYIQPKDAGQYELAPRLAIVRD